MRIGIDLRSVASQVDRHALALEADELGLWAVLVGGAAGEETIEAAAIAAQTSSIHIGVHLDGHSGEHPLTLAEELAVLDHLSERRALGVVDGDRRLVEHVADLLAGRIVDGVALTPPPAQTALPVWAATDIERCALTGDVAVDGPLIDRRRDEGCTHLFVSWPGSLLVLARHLATRAAGPDFPTIVAELADQL
ncbi:MAG: hypothetical protein ACR2QO_02200 [Acidimicrobiales bacterium]